MKPGRTVTPVATPIAGNSVRSRSRLWAFGWLAMALLVMAWVGVTWRLLSSPIDLRVPPYTPEDMVLVPRGRSSFMRPLAGTSSSAALSRVREDALDDPALT